MKIAAFSILTLTFFLAGCSISKHAMEPEEQITESGGIRVQAQFYPDSTSGSTQYLTIGLSKTTDSVVVFYLPVRNDDQFAQLTIQQAPDRITKKFPGQADFMYTPKNGYSNPLQFGVKNWEENKWITWDFWKTNKVLTQFNIPADVTDGVFTFGFRMLQFNENPSDQANLSSLAFRDEYRSGKISVMIQNRKLAGIKTMGK